MKKVLWLGIALAALLAACAAQPAAPATATAWVVTATSPPPTATPLVTILVVTATPIPVTEVPLPTAVVSQWSNGDTVGEQNVYLHPWVGATIPWTYDVGSVVEIHGRSQADVGEWLCVTLGNELPGWMHRTQLEFPDVSDWNAFWASLSEIVEDLTGGPTSACPPATSWP